ncbi:uncharacterized protein V1518DRAFT_419223 [Limtongia smithiae]|uniref:uncharacterized protein n=1 Tax=Limtongia smithiae TaxID=1125753 RepID=UPI0034CFB230
MTRLPGGGSFPSRVRSHSRAFGGSGVAHSYVWLLHCLRASINRVFRARADAGQPLVDRYGRVFTAAAWRTPPQFKAAPLPDCRIRSRSVATLKREALLDQLVCIFGREHPLRLPPGPTNAQRRMRILEAVSTLGTDIVLPVAPATDKRKLPYYVVRRGHTKNRAMTPEWMTISTMRMPLNGHDHSDIFSDVRGKRSGRVVTKAVYRSLMSKGRTIDELDSWIRCARAPTAQSALRVMMRRQGWWPPFLLLFTLLRRLRKADLRRVMAIVSRQYADMDMTSQMLVFVRLLRHVFRENTHYLPRLAQLFVDSARDTLRTSFVYNRLMYLMCVKTTLNYKNLATCQALYAAQQVLLQDMARRGLLLMREGYLALAAVLRTDSPELAHRILARMRLHGYPLLSAGRTLEALITHSVEANMRARYLPQGDNSEAVARILVAGDVYSATRIFDDLGARAQQDVRMWDAIIAQVVASHSMAPEVAFDVWRRIVASGAQPDKFIVQKLLRVLATAEQAQRMVALVREQKLHLSRRIVREFVLCCHRDRTRDDAMLVARAFVAAARPKDDELRLLLNRIHAYRRWKLREYHIARAQAGARERSEDQHQQTWDGVVL